MDQIKQVIALLLLAACVHILITSVMMNKHQQELKYDLAAINDARYGMFNSNTWKTELKGVLVKQITEFELTGDNRAVLKQQLEQMLATLVDEVERNFTELDGFFNKIKGFLTNQIVNFDQIRADIPNYADAILDDLEEEENVEALKQTMLSNLDRWIQDESLSLETPRSLALAKHGCESVESCNEQIKTEINFKKEQLWIYTALAMVFSLLIFVILFFTETGKLPLYGLSLTSLLLLIGGLVLPMLDLQAGLKDVQFEVMGEVVRFENQVLFFQSKSIMDVIRTLFASSTFNGILVGALILLFSVVFPAGKLMASLFRIFSLTENRLIDWLVFKSGKWSMADVLVVAVFMAYLGFSGLINSQFNSIPQSEEFTSVAFNDSVFQPGYSWFIAFCLSALFLSVAIERKLIR